MPTIVGGRTGQFGRGGPVSVGVKVIGANELIAKLVKMRLFARLEMGFITFNAARKIEARAKALVPVQSGNLRSGIRSIKLASYDWAVSASSMDGTDSEKNQKEYAGFVEYGTSKMAARPFMRPATAGILAETQAKLAALGQRLVSL